MKADTPLDYAVFQLTPTRTRCELLVSAGGVTEKLASGLLKPFLAHLRAAEEQIAQGGYSIRLDPKAAGVSNGAAPWFSKGTMERFVRFVSTPEVLERVSTVEAELMQLEEAINMQSMESARGDDGSRNAPATPPPAAKQLYGLSMDKSVGPLKVEPKLTPSRRESVDGSDLVGESSKRRLLRAMDARRLMLQKEQGMAFARAAAAGFDMDHMNDLMIFAECFGAARLRDACLKFMALCKKRQEAGLWIEELDLTAAEAGFMRSDGLTGPDKHDTWSDVHSESGDTKMEEVYDDGTGRSQTSYYGEGRGYFVEESTQTDGNRRKGPQNEPMDVNGESSSSYRPRGKPQYGSVQQQHADESTGAGYVQEGSGRYHTDDGLMGPRPSLWQQQAAPPPLKPPSLGKFAGARLPNESGYPEHAVPGDFRDAETGRLIRPRGTWSVQTPRSMPNYAHMGDGDAYDTRSQYEAGYSSSSRGNRSLAPSNFHGNQTGMQDGYSQQDHMNEQHLPPAWQQPTHHSWQQGQRYPEGPGYDPRAPPQGYADTQFSTEGDYSGGAPAASSDWQGATPTKGQPLSKNDGHNLGPPSYDSLSKDIQSPTELSNNRRPTRRSSSPKRRSPSPMKRVQIGRNGQRRSGMVVIRNINYITSSSQDRSAEKDRSNPKGSDDDENGESDLETDSEEESLPRKAQSVRMSVQDAISLFEGKKREGAKKKAGKKESRRGSVESGGSLGSQRSSFKRWSGASEASSDSNLQAHQENDVQDTSSGEVQSRLDQQKQFSGEDVAFMNARTGLHAHPAETKQASSSGMWPVDQFEEEVTSNNVVPLKPVPEEFSMHPIRDGRVNRSTEPSHYYTEELQAKNKAFQSEDASIVLPVREGLDFSKNWHESDDIGEHQGLRSQRRPVADDSFILGDRAEPTMPGHVPNSRTLNPAELNSTLRDESKNGSKHTAVDDSFMVLARPHHQDQSRRMALNMESELPTDQHGSVEAAADDGSRSYEPEDVFMMPERNVNRDSIGRAWNDYDLEFEGEGHRQEDETDGSVAGEGGSPKSEKGRFYDKYRERRDAKLREESGPKRAERDAKLKAMQEVLERRKAEMTARVGRTTERSNPLAEAQARADKLRAYKAGLVRSKKEKEEEEKKRLEDLRVQRRERIAARSSPTSVGTQSAASTPRASARQPQTTTPKPNIVRKLSPTPQKAAASVTTTTPRSSARSVASSSPRPLPKSSPNPRRSQAGSSYPGDNPLSRSVPSLAELRKENTKPSGRIGTNTGQDPKSVSVSKSAAHTSRQKPSAEAALLEANGGVPTSRTSRVSADEKKRVGTRKSLSGIPEPRGSTYPALEKTVLGPLKVSRDLLPEPPSVASKFGRRSLPSAQDAKPFLRKGTGIGPGAGPGVRKLKDSLAEAQKLLEDETASNADTASVADACATPTLEAQDIDVTGLILEPSSVLAEKADIEDAENDVERAGVGPGLTVIRAPASTSAVSTGAEAPLKLQAPADAGDVPTASADAFEDREPVEPLRGSGEDYAAPVAVVSSSPPPSPPAVAETYSQSSANPSSSYRPTLQLTSDAYDAPYAAVTRSPKTHSPSVHSPSVQSPSVHNQGFPLPVPPFSPGGPVPPSAPSAPSTPIPVKKTLLEALSSSDVYVAPLAPASTSPARGEVYARASDAGEYDGSLAGASASPSHVRSPLYLASLEQYSAPIALASASPAASPASHTLPQLRHTVSPNLEAVKSAVPASKKWVGSHKPAPSTQQPPKEAAKSGGLKRLLKFGRKSTGSTSASTSSNSNSKADWVSAEVDDEADDNYAESRPQGKGSKYRAPVSGKSSRNVGNSTEFSSSTIHEDSFNDYSTSSVRSSIPAPPANFKLREDHLSGGTNLKAPRSFFSLSSFRSKGSEGKYRA